MVSLNNILKNSQNIKSITDFRYYSGENGVFVRIVGEDEKISDEVNKMDTELSQSTVRGICAYKRISGLPNITMPEDISFYTECYNNWLRSGRRRLESKRISDNDNDVTELSLVVNEVIRQLRILKPLLTDSMEKNAVIKLLFRYDSVMQGFADKRGFSVRAKLAADNITKEQDYLFFCMLALMGINVLLIQNRSDVDMYQKQLNLSVSSVTGHLGNSVLPEYKEQTATRCESNIRIRTAPPTVRTEPTVRVTLPPRPQRNRPTQDASANLPYAPTVRTQPTQEQERPSVRITIPPHPNRNNSNSRGNSFFSPPQQNTRQTGSYTQPAPPVRNTPVRTPSAPPAQSDPSGYTGGYSSVVTGTYQTGRTDAYRHELSYEQLARLASSIVQILVFKGQAGPNQEPSSGGSGIMIGTDGYVLTNCHVVDAGRSYGVRIENDPNIYTTNRLIKYHRDLDLAVLKIDRRLEPLRVYSGSQGLARGQRVVAIGSPLGLFNTVSDGIISGFRNIDGVNMIQFTAPISHGSSGGAVLNMYGEVIGISTAGIKDGQNINLAVPYDAINAFCRSFL